MGIKRFSAGAQKKAEGNRPLTGRQRKFVDAYDGNGTEACRKAGYKGNSNVLGQVAHDNLKNPKIMQAIKERQQPHTGYIIASRQERQAFWTEIMNDESLYPGDRMRASELLGKSEGDFLTKVELSGKVTLEDLVAGSLGSKDQSDDDDGE